MQQTTCTLARGLKNALVDLTSDTVVHQVKPAMNEKRTIMLC